MTVFGPDVSAWQDGLVPPEPPGIGFGICRATNGEAIDPVVDNVIAWCKQRTVPFCRLSLRVRMLDPFGGGAGRGVPPGGRRRHDDPVHVRLGRRSRRQLPSR